MNSNRANIVKLLPVLVFCLFGARSGLSLDEGFEGALPDFHLYQATCATDTARAHSGTNALRVTPAKDFGGAYFKLDGIRSFEADFADRATRVFVVE